MVFSLRNYRCEKILSIYSADYRILRILEFIFTSLFIEKYQLLHIHLFICTNVRVDIHTAKILLLNCSAG